jgi:hypothetical protein
MSSYKESHALVDKGLEVRGPILQLVASSNLRQISSSCIDSHNSDNTHRVWYLAERLNIEEMINFIAVPIPGLI